MSEALGSNGSTSMGSVRVDAGAAQRRGWLKAPVPASRWAWSPTTFAEGAVDGVRSVAFVTSLTSSAPKTFGDMDFKVAGSLWISGHRAAADTKLDGIPSQVLSLEHSEQAKDARLNILEAEAIDRPDEISLTPCGRPSPSRFRWTGSRSSTQGQGHQRHHRGDRAHLPSKTTAPCSSAPLTAIGTGRDRQDTATANPQLPICSERLLGTVVKTTDSRCLYRCCLRAATVWYISKLGKASKTEGRGRCQCR